MGRNFDDYPGFQPFRSWANTYAQDCKWKSILVPIPNHFQKPKSSSPRQCALQWLWRRPPLQIALCSMRTSGPKWVIRLSDKPCTDIQLIVQVGTTLQCTIGTLAYLTGQLTRPSDHFKHSSYAQYLCTYSQASCCWQEVVSKHLLSSSQYHKT